MAVTEAKKHVHALALDRGSARTIDDNGFLHVPGCNISKATVNPYWGAEIPDAAELGLEPDKVYYLFRDPKELEKAVATFNNLPLMDYHVEVSADELENPEVKNKIVGSTGTDAVFQDPYLVNSLVVWAAGAIEGIKTKQQTELSCAYRYKLDMTPGEYNGQKYDGRMYDIIGNHVALVDEGRAGHDVTVKDGMPAKKFPVSPAKAIAAALAKPKATDKLTVRVDMRGVAKLIADALAPIKKKLGMAKDCVPDLIMQLTRIKAQIEDELKPGVEGEDAKVLDDCTSAIDSAVHHLLDYTEDQDSEGGMAGDDNPQGINQYTGAAGHANRVGKAAGKSGGPSHKDAQGAHMRAANAARKEGNSSAANQHLRVAAAHGTLHSNPGNAAASATLAGHYGKGDANPEGINQYTGGGGAKAASSAANAASKSARTAKEHHAASALHMKAVKEHAKAAREAKTPGQKAEHERQANNHNDQANQHTRAERFAKWHASGKSHFGPGGKVQAGDTALATDKIVHVPGHKDSSGKAAPWVIKSETTGKVIWSGGSKAEAAAQLRNVEGHKSRKAADGSITVDVAEREDVSPEAGKQKYGEVKFADPKNKKYPIDTPEHVRSALSYWGRTKNRNIYSKEDQDTITKNIEAAAKRFKIGEFAESK